MITSVRGKHLFLSQNLLNYFCSDAGRSCLANPSTICAVTVYLFIYLQEVHCNDRFVLHGWQPRPAYNPSTPNNGMCRYYSPYSFSGRVRMLISLTKGL